MAIDTIVFMIGRGEETARVTESGEVEGDPGLVAHLRERLTEPVTVWRHGTVRSREGAEEVAIQLHPGDGRYVVARIRLLCADGDCELLEAVWS